MPSKQVQKILKSRRTTHGDFSDGAKFCQIVMNAAMAAPSWHLMSDVNKEVMHHIVQKLQRAVCGDPNVEEHWLDIAGYAQIAADRVTRRRR